MPSSFRRGDHEPATSAGMHTLEGLLAPPPAAGFPVEVGVGSTATTSVSGPGYPAPSPVGVPAAKLVQRTAAGWTAALVADEPPPTTSHGDEGAGQTVTAPAPQVAARIDDDPTGPIAVAQLTNEPWPGRMTTPPVVEDRRRGELAAPPVVVDLEQFGTELLLRPAQRPPRSGWRLLAHRVTGGSWNPGESTAEQAQRAVEQRVAQPIQGDYKCAVLSLKGGVGKTTVTTMLGSTFAALRGDHVVAVDANPDRGTLGARVASQTAATVRDLLGQPETITRFSDVRAYTSQAPSRLEVLASERDPSRAEAFSEADYRAAAAVLERFYTVILADCGTGLTHSAMAGVLGTADAVILVASPAVDGVQAVDATVAWLRAQGYGHLVDRAVVVISASRPGSPPIPLARLVDHFADRVRAVQIIPFDEHLAQGTEIDPTRVNTAVREAFVQLAATVADDFAGARGRGHGRNLPGPEPVWAPPPTSQGFR